MAKGGKRRGSGRKPTGKVPMLVRVAPETRTRLEREAKEKRQSLSAIAERHLTGALYGQPVDPQTRALCYLITVIPRMAQDFARVTPFEFSWRTNRFDFEVLKDVVNEILDRLAPPGAPEGGRYGGLNDYARRLGVEVSETERLDEDSPQALGSVIATAILSGLTLPKSLLAAGETRNAPGASEYYAIPQAARDLAFPTLHELWLKETTND